MACDREVKRGRLGLQKRKSSSGSITVNSFLSIAYDFLIIHAAQPKLGIGKIGVE